MTFFRRLFGGKGSEDDSSPDAEDKTQSNKDKPVVHYPAKAPTPDKADSKTASSEAMAQGDSATNELPRDSGLATSGRSEAADLYKEKEDEPDDDFPPQIPDGVTRPLPAEPTYPMPSGRLNFGVLSDPGMVRQNNQDAAMAFFFTSDTAEDRPDFGLFIVADGMGGHHDGEKASALTARAVAAEVMSKIYLPVLNGLDNMADMPPIAESMAMAAQRANQKVLNDIPDGGTTLSAAVVFANTAHIVHVGDSRIYLIQQGKIEQITRDHSLVQRLIELGQLDPADSEDHPNKNVLYRAIGQTDNLEVDTITRRLPPGSSLLFCSDGLWGTMENEEILQIVNQNDNPQEACEKLIALANTHGGHDNITALLLKLPDD